MAIIMPMVIITIMATTAGIIAGTGTTGIIGITGAITTTTTPIACTATIAEPRRTADLTITSAIPDLGWRFRM